MQDIYFGTLGKEESLDELLRSVADAAGSVDEAVLLSDRRLLDKVDRVVSAKAGVDKKTLEELKREHQKSQQTYLSLFAAIEDELIRKGDLKLQL